MLFLGQNNTLMNSYHIFKSAINLQKHLTQTPFSYSKHLSEKHEANIFIKFESLQICNTLKTRGVLNQLLNTNEKSIVVVSSDYIGYILSHFCKKFCLELTVVIPENANHFFINLIKKNKASILLHGNSFDESMEFAKNLKGYLFIPNEHYFYGCGTAAYEILKSEYDINTIFLSNSKESIETYANSFNPTINVIDCVEKYNQNVLKKVTAEFLKNEKVMIDRESAKVINSLSNYNLKGQKVAVIVTSEEEELFNKKLYKSEYILNKDIEQDVIDIKFLKNQTQITKHC